MEYEGNLNTTAGIGKATAPLDNALQGLLQAQEMLEKEVAEFIMRLGPILRPTEPTTQEGQLASSHAPGSSSTVYRIEDATAATYRVLSAIRIAKDNLGV